MKRVVSILLPLALMAGCANYTWTSSVPEDLRLVAVPTFANDSGLVGAGSAVSREVLREIQREGTFKVVPTDEAAIEVQGTVVSGELATESTGRMSYVRLRENEMTLVARVSFVDRRNGRVLADNRDYSALVTFVAGTDRTTPKNGAVERAAGDLARQIVDDLVDFKWKKGAENE